MQELLAPLDAVDLGKVFLHCQLNHQYVAEGLAPLEKLQQLENLVAVKIVVGEPALRQMLHVGHPEGLAVQIEREPADP